MSEQKNAGRKLSDGRTIWHMNSRGGYWSGWMPDNVSPEELYYACITTATDILKNHPEILEKIKLIMSQPSDER